MSMRNSRALSALGVALFCIILVAFLKWISPPSQYASDRKMNAQVLDALLANGSAITDVEKAFGSGRALTNAVEEVQIRSFFWERGNNVTKARSCARAVEYSPLFGNPWDIIVFVFYDQTNRIADYCFGAQ